MGNTDKLTKAISLLLFIALLGYVGVYVWRSVSNPIQTAIAINVTVRESANLSGIVIRDEHVIESSAAYIDVTAVEGKRLAKGQVAAVSYQSDAALERAGRVRELELEIARMETLLSSLDTAQSLAKRDSVVKNAVLSISSAVARRDLSELDINSLNLRSLVFESADSSASQEALHALQLELSGLYSGSHEGTVAILAEDSGVFSTILDGYEHLSAENISLLSPEAIRLLSQDRQEPGEYAIGKLVTSSIWYYAAVADSSEVWLPDGSEKLEAGDRAYLEFGGYYNTSISARVVSVSRDYNGECVMVFSCNEALVDTLAMRQSTSEVVYAEYTGVRVPKDAVHSETGGDDTVRYYVYTLTGVQAERKPVKIIYEAEDFFLVERSIDAGALREGNDIIVTANDLYDGKILG